MAKESIACFRGDHPERFSIINQGERAYMDLVRRVEKAIFQSFDDGYTTFICGMSKGFDLVAANIVMALKTSRAELADLNLVAVRPFEGHGFPLNPWHVLYQMVLGAASEVVTLAPHYHRRAYHDCDLWVVQHSSRLIRNFTKKQGEVNSTVKYAEHRGLFIVDI